MTKSYFITLNDKQYRVDITPIEYDNTIGGSDDTTPDGGTQTLSLDDSVDDTVSTDTENDASTDTNSEPEVLSDDEEPVEA